MRSEERRTGMGLWTDSKQMLEAARLLMTNGMSVKMPMYYLLGHSLEVGIKSFILSKGASQKCLRDMGHDLVGGVEWSIPCGLETYFSFTEKQLGMVVLLNKYYRSKELEYRVTGIKQLPDEVEFANMVECLLDSIKSFCKESLE